MIIIFQNHQITAVDKELLQILKCSLNDLSDKISQIDLALKSIQNSEIKIENEFFSVKEVQLISLENFAVYELSKQTSELPLEIKPAQSAGENLDFLTQTAPEENKTESLLGDFEIKPIEPSPNLNFPEQTTANEKETLLKEITPLEVSGEEKKEADFSLETPVKSETELNISSGMETPKENLFEIETSNKPLEETAQPQEISITFEDEFEEIEKILSLNDKEAKTLILQDLEKASADFDMDMESIKELYNDLINQIETNRDNFYNAIKAHDYEEMHKIAHSLKGASLNLRVSNLAIILKTIDEKSKEKISFDKLEFLVNNFYAFVNKVKTLELEKNDSKETKADIPELLKKLILATIKEYTATQNEKKLKKDLKYIEKLLNVKINSIEELQNMIKAVK